MFKEELRIDNSLVAVPSMSVSGDCAFLSYSLSVCRLSLCLCEESFLSFSPIHYMPTSPASRLEPAAAARMGACTLAITERQLPRKSLSRLDGLAGTF